MRALGCIPPVTVRGAEPVLRLGFGAPPFQMSLPGA